LRLNTTLRQKDFPGELKNVTLNGSQASLQWQRIMNQIEEEVSPGKPCGPTTYLVKLSSNREGLFAV